MAVTTEELRTVRGDEIKVTLFEHAGEAPSILVTVVDSDRCLIPTAELSLTEVAEFRELLRKLCEQSERTSWRQRGQRGVST